MNSQNHSKKAWFSTFNHLKHIAINLIKIYHISNHKMLNLKEKGRENTGVYSGSSNRPYYGLYPLFVEKFYVFPLLYMLLKYRVNYKDSFRLWIKPIQNLLCKVTSGGSKARRPRALARALGQFFCNFLCKFL